MSGEKKEKKPRKNNKLYAVYEISGENITRKNPSCPKCGPGVMMAAHSRRKTCGRCGYTEFTVKEKTASEEDIPDKRMKKKTEIRKDDIEQAAADEEKLNIKLTKEDVVAASKDEE